MGIPIDAYAERKYQETMRDTWGHLAPKENQKYLGGFVFAVGCYGGLEPVVISCGFDGLDDSPWFYQSLYNYIFTLDMEAGKVYRFKGDFCNTVFDGQVSEIVIV